MQGFTPHIDNALLAQKNNKLWEWTVDLLLSEGNSELVKSLKQVTPASIEIFNFPLKMLKKISGPEEIEEHRMPPHVWEEQVCKLTELIKNGYEPAPLIVTDYWNYIEIADGNHRHEALLRNGIESYWTIFLIKHKKGLEYIQNIMKLQEK